MNYNTVLFECFFQKDSERLNYLEVAHKTSKEDLLVFWNYLNNSFTYLYNSLQKSSENKSGVDINSFKLPIALETNLQLTSHYGTRELKTLQYVLIDFGVTKGLNITLYNYEGNIQFIDYTAPSKIFNIKNNFSEVSFKNELAGKEGNEINDFLDFHFRYYKRAVKFLEDKDSLINKWLFITRNKLPYQFDKHQKDIFLSWFEKDIEGPINEISLSSLITNENGIEIVKKLKVKYKNIKGKRLKLLYLALQDLGLLPKERNASVFHRCCLKEFGKGIGSYNAMNEYQYNQNVDLADYKEMLDFISNIKIK